MSQYTQRMGRGGGRLEDDDVEPAKAAAVTTPGGDTAKTPEIVDPLRR
jgi:hypothetical protein